MDPLSYILAGVAAVFQGPEMLSVLGLGLSYAVVMVAFGFVTGIVVGATPGLGGPMAMAISLPILISIFGYSADVLLPVMGFLIGVMKGATLGGAVPAILFNTPGTPDAFMTTLDGYPMTRAGKAKKALKVAHFASASGDTCSDLVLFVFAPFLAIAIEAYLDLPEKTALYILSLSFIATVVGGSAGKGLIALGLGLLVAYVGTGEDFYPRLSFGSEALAQGFGPAPVFLGVLILGEIFATLETLWRERRGKGVITQFALIGDQSLGRKDLIGLLPTIGRSAAIGTAIGALPGIGSTLAATMGYAANKRIHARKAPPSEPKFGEGAPEGIAATEAANSAVSGANLIPVLSLGIPGNTAAVFLILAAESIGGFNPGPSVFKFSETSVNPELVIAFGLFTMMMLANVLNWTLGGLFMRSLGFLVRVPREILMPVVLLVTLTSVYVESPNFSTILFTLAFGVVGYLMRKVAMSPLPFVIAFILGARLEETARQAFAATGSDPWFLVNRPIALIFILLSVAVIVWSTRKSEVAS